jgi:hypothetical protein
MLICLLALLFAADVEPEPPSPAKVIAQWRFRSGRELIAVRGNESGTWVLKNSEELFKASVAYRSEKTDLKSASDVESVTCQYLKVKAIDWDKQMLLVVTAGRQLTQDSHVALVGLKMRGNALVVSWKLHEPQAKKGGGPAVMDHPGVVLLVPRFNGKVLFEQKK